jgi:cyclopropane fatty-acyl-phospholipid synthase-like methyltransferase/DNA-binding CsgD family transcriptional regulator
MIIPQEFMKPLADHCGITSAEWQVLSLAIEGTSIEDISKKLGIEQPAIRKRLGNIYQKFDISGKGPGKLVRLQHFFISEYQKYSGKKKILLAWIGNDGKSLAEGLKNTIFQHPKLEIWIPSYDLSTTVHNILSEPNLFPEVDFGIVCLRGSSALVNFDIGVLLGKLQYFKLILFQSSLNDTISDIPSINGMDKDDLVILLGDMFDSDVSEARKWVNYRFSEWEKAVNEVLYKPSTASSSADELLRATQQVEKAVRKLSESNLVLENQGFQHIIVKSLSKISQQLVDSTRSTYSIPAALYPHYLVSLQKKLHVRIKALTVVDQEEFSWQERIGKEIWQSAQHESTRIFALTEKEDLDNNFDEIEAHAKKYNVSVMSYETLAKDFPGFCKCFGIIEAADSKILVENTTDELLKYRCFSIDKKKVAFHEEILNKIIERAVSIEIDESQSSEQRLKRVRDLTFGRLPTIVRPVAMSEYVDVDDYDAYEAEKFFFPEMIKVMLSLLNQHRRRTKRTIQILELGAGTGHLTEHLAQVKNSNLIAIELDWLCFKKLKRKIGFNSNVTITNRDSCTYDPDGTFNYIFSALADQHIREQDKETYLTNVWRNLDPGDLFIIGDEFLLPHNSEDQNERQNALRAFHHNMIRIAENDEKTEVAKLEAAALSSALENRGSFKVSCRAYENLLTKVGFKFEKIEITSQKQEETGGVYVYKVEKMETNPHSTLQTFILPKDRGLNS